VSRAVADAEWERVIRGILRATVCRTTSDQRKWATTGEVEKEGNNDKLRGDPKKLEHILVASMSYCATH